MKAKIEAHRRKRVEAIFEDLVEVEKKKEEEKMKNKTKKEGKERKKMNQKREERRNRKRSRKEEMEISSAEWKERLDDSSTKRAKLKED